jgi:uncharacterized cupin superfamily protein
MAKIDIASLPVHSTTTYPPPYDKVAAGRSRQRLGNAIGLTQFGVNLCRLKPGAQSSLRHWHTHEDELIYVLEGEVVLIEEQSETPLKAGDAAGWKANSGNGHCLVNRTDREALILEVGARGTRDTVEYPGSDLRFEKDENGVRRLHASGEPY